MLAAPRGVVNAGDAGIVAGNLTIAATAVLGADNISVTGVAVGVPVDTGGLGASLAGVRFGGQQRQQLSGDRGRRRLISRPVQCSDVGSRAVVAGCLRDRAGRRGLVGDDVECLETSVDDAGIMSQPYRAHAALFVCAYAGLLGYFAVTDPSNPVAVLFSARSAATDQSPRAGRRFAVGCCPEYCR